MRLLLFPSLALVLSTALLNFSDGPLLAQGFSSKTAFRTKSSAFLRTKSPLFSTTEDETQSKGKTTKQDKKPLFFADPEESQKENGKALNGMPSSSSNLEQNLSFKNENYVLIGGNRTDIDNDPTLHLLTSEERVWQHFRNGIPESIPLGVVGERTLDTVEDAICHLRRKAYEMGTIQLTPGQEDSRKTVVVLGSGWGAHALMKVADCQKLRIIVVSPINHFVFTPMLASASVGTVEYRSMTEAVRRANPLIDEYIEGKATEVDVENKKVTVQLNKLVDDTEAPTLELDYDHLVVSVGSRVDDRNVPGAKEHALRLKKTDDARRLRTSVGECFEYASRPGVSEEERTRRVTFMIAGGGPTGVELAGELDDLFRDITRKHEGTYPRLANNTRVILAHGGDSLVPQFEVELRQKALKSLQDKGVEVFLNTRVTEVTDKSCTLSIKKFDPETGEVLPDREEVTVPVSLTVWCAGTSTVPFTETLLKQLPPEARNKDGRVLVDRWMRPPMKDPSLFGSVLVIGDATAQPYGEGKEGFLPATAQVAGQQGAFIARTLCRNYNLTQTPPQLNELDTDANGKTSKNDVFYDPDYTNWLKVRGLETSPPFTFLNLGILAYLGGGEALSQVQVGDVPVLSKAGKAGYLLWRSVYLVKQVATRNRVLVTFDWIKSAIFGRDITRF